MCCLCFKGYLIGLSDLIPTAKVQFFVNTSLFCYKFFLTQLLKVLDWQTKRKGNVRFCQLRVAIPLLRLFISLGNESYF